MAHRWGLVLLGTLTGLLVMAVTSPWPDPWGMVLVSIGEHGDHGVHLSDLPAAALWVLGLVALLRLRRS